MDRVSYIERMLDCNDLVYIDTSTLMNVEAMSLFVGRAEPAFLFRDMKIIVPEVVFQELQNHVHSYDEEKRVKASAALELIGQFDDLFKVEKSAVKDSSNNTFADSELLALLTINKSSHSQLLITNDRDLSKDAFSLNDQESNRGRKVMVCHINHFGYLKRCECTNTHIEEDTITAPVSETPKEKIVYIHEENSSSHSSWKIPVAIVGGILGGIAIDRYVIPFCKFCLYV